MKKIERLRWVEANFGPGFVLKYFFCRSWQEIEQAICFFGAEGKTWGMRTDFVAGATQGFLLPFILNGTRKAAEEIWQQHGEKFYYLVSLNLPLVKLHGVALLLGKEHIFVEINDKEPTISLRGMYNHPENLRQFCVGPSSYMTWGPQVFRCFKPKEASIYCLDTLYCKIITHKITETEFTITPERQVVVW